MSMGQIRTVVICEESTSPVPGTCPNGMSISTIKAYVLLPSSQQYFEDANNPIDFTQVSLHFSYAFGLVIGFYVLSKAFGMLYRVIK